MIPQTFIFFGKSGCGKGTQAKNLITYLEKADPSTRTMYIETGQKLREFSDEVGISADITKKMMSEGKLLPSFIPIWIWTTYFVRHMTGKEHLVLDGLSRRQYEAPILDDALRFYGRPSPTVIVINVSDEWAKQHLLARGRADDKKIDIDARLAWYKSNVEPTVEYFRKNSYYKVLDINGEQSIEEVWSEIQKKTGFA